MQVDKQPSLIAIAIAVFLFLGKFTYDIYRGVNPPRHVKDSAEPITIGSAEDGYELKLPAKWKALSEAGKAYYRSIGIEEDQGERLLLCEPKYCGNSILLGVKKVHGTTHHEPGGRRWSAESQAEVFTALGCGKDPNKYVQSLPDQGAAIGYFISCAADQIDLKMAFYGWGDETLYISTRTVEKTDAELRKSLALEAADGFQQLPKQKRGPEGSPS